MTGKSSHQGAVAEEAKKAIFDNGVLDDTGTVLFIKGKTAEESDSMRGPFPGWCGFGWLGLPLCVGLVAGCGAKPHPAPEQPVLVQPRETPPVSRVGVQLRKGDVGWELTRDGSPYFVRGAGGEGSKDLLARLGGNSVRTWDTDDLQRKLDEAHRHGLSVAVGIWLGHERHGFNYRDPAQVAKQQDTVRETILRYKDHPAVLLWGLGNEMEGYENGDNPAVWTAVNDLAKLAKSLDPNHPTMTVVAEIGGQRVPSINRLCPDSLGDEQIVQNPNRLHRHRRERGVKLREAQRSPAFDNGEDDRFTPIHPLGQERVCAVELGGLTGELTLNGGAMKSTCSIVTRQAFPCLRRPPRSPGTSCPRWGWTGTGQ